MSSLSIAEQNLFENLFGMSSGYVLNFTNQQFSKFFKKAINIDIYDVKYALNGASKAKRLRAFWDIESNSVVGKILSELLEVWRTENLSSLDNPYYSECVKVTNRLIGKHEELTENAFLQKDFGEISLQTLPIESILIPIIDCRLKEIQKCLSNNSSLAVIFLCGSVLEGILLGSATKHPEHFNKAISSPKDENGKVKRFQDWTLAQLIDVAHELNHIKLDVKKFSHVLRDFRNYIHPFQQLVSGFQPDEHTAKICYQVLKAAIASLSGDRS